MLAYRLAPRRSLSTVFGGPERLADLEGLAVSGGVPLIGKEIPWKAIRGDICRVRDVGLLASLVNDAVIDAGSGFPYAILEIESRTVSSAKLPVTHRHDFRRLWKAYRDRGVAADEELLVVYHPRRDHWLYRLIQPFMPKLHFRIYSRGAYEILSRPETWPLDGKLPQPRQRWDIEDADGGRRTSG